MFSSVCIYVQHICHICINQYDQCAYIHIHIWYNFYMCMGKHVFFHCEWGEKSQTAESQCARREGPPGFRFPKTNMANQKTLKMMNWHHFFWTRHLVSRPKNHPLNHSGLPQDHALASAGGCNIFTNFVPRKKKPSFLLQAVNVRRRRWWSCVILLFCLFFSQVHLADVATLANIYWDIFCLSTFQDGSWIATNNDRQVQYDLPSPEVVVCWGAWIFTPNKDVQHLGKCK